MYIYIYIYIYMYVDFLSWQVEYIDIWQVAYIYMYVGMWIFKISKLSKLIFGKFFL